MKTELVKRSPVLLVVFEEDTSFLNERNESLLIVKDIDWNRDLSPWHAEKVFRKGEDFAGRADETIAQLLDALDQYSFEKTVICGYSLAGLFALYACTRTDRFDGCVSASGSLWYPGFTEYLKEHPVKCGYVYLSLGDQEKNTKNPVMASVQEKTEETYSILKEYVSVRFEMNRGNHFHEPERRLLKGIEQIADEL